MRNAHKTVIEEQGLYITERGGALSPFQKSLGESTERANATVRRGLAEPGMRTVFSEFGSVILTTISDEGRYEISMEAMAQNGVPRMRLNGALGTT